MNKISDKKNIKVAVAMSGGVDSSVVAALMSEKGYKVIGLTMQLYNNQNNKSSKSCCAGQDIYDAKHVANRLGIPHYVLDYEKKFHEQVINPFVESYRNGETPIPCILCNQTVKFSDLIKASKEIGADFLATGHYIQKHITNDEVKLYRAKDKTKDQSYFLFATTMEQLKYLIFPLGGYTKDETRKIALKYNLDVANKPDSQDICFVPSGKYTGIIEKNSINIPQKGKIVNMNGEEISEHQGIENFTIGQRKGLGIGGLKDPLYVVSIDPDKNIVVVGPRSSTSREIISLRDVNWLLSDFHLLKDGLDISVKIRNTQEPIKARIKKDMTSNKIKIYFNEPLYGVSPGQACVFYQNDRVLGGGWIEKDIYDFIPHNKRQLENNLNN